MTTFFVVPYVKGPAYQYLRFFKPCSGLYPAKGASTWVVMSQLHHMMIWQPFWKLSGTCFSVPILHTGLCSSIAQFPWCPTVSLRQLENLIIFFFSYKSYSEQWTPWIFVQNTRLPSVFLRAQIQYDQCCPKSYLPGPCSVVQTLDSVIHQAPVAQKLDSVIHQINLG